MAQNLDLKALSVTELKALAYDLQALMAQTQQNLQVVGQELKSRLNQPVQHTGVGEQTVTS
jgi:hypothetical protein